MKSLVFPIVIRFKSFLYFVSSIPTDVISHVLIIVSGNILYMSTDV